MIQHTASPSESVLKNTKEYILSKEDIELTNENCCEFVSNLNKNSVDLFLIDPPYDISRKTGFKSVGKKSVERFAVSMDFGNWDWCSTNMELVVQEAYRSLKKGGTIIIFYDLWKISHLSDWLTKAGFKQLRFIEWIKTNPVPINSKANYLTNSREIAITAVKGGSSTFNSKYDNGIYKYPICHEKGRFHPTQKPLALMKELIEKHSNIGDLVVDCFSGSGSTAHACVDLNRKFKGCELETDYFNKSQDRLIQAINKRGK
jgi:site-specific DNA-methyltransferase (adenine-specific)